MESTVDHTIGSRRTSRDQDHRLAAVALNVVQPFVHLQTFMLHAWGTAYMDNCEYAARNAENYFDALLSIVGSSSSQQPSSHQS